MVATAEISEVPDFGESFRQYMKQKMSYEFICGQRHHFPAIPVFVILPAACNFTSCIAMILLLAIAMRCVYLPRYFTAVSAEWWLAVNSPLFFVTDSEQSVKANRIISDQPDGSGGRLPEKIYVSKRKDHTWAKSSVWSFCMAVLQSVKPQKPGPFMDRAGHNTYQILVDGKHSMYQR